MTTTTQFRSTQTPSGKTAFEAWCAVWESNLPVHVMIAAPTIDTLKEAWGYFAMQPLDAARAQHVWIVKFDGGAPKDAPGISTKENLVQVPGCQKPTDRNRVPRRGEK